MHFKIQTLFILAWLSFLNLARSQLLTMDYFVTLLKGLKMNEYVPEAIECSYFLRNSQYDILAITEYFGDKRTSMSHYNQSKFEKGL